MDTPAKKSLIIKSLKDVQDYCENNQDYWGGVLDKLEHTLTAARDSSEVPIYLTKGRIKNAESAFLKFKRKGRSDPSQITDWIGFRVLCLFQQDLYAAFRYIFELLVNSRGLNQKDSGAVIEYFSMKEIIIFNWPADRANRLIDEVGVLMEAKDSKTIKRTSNGLEVAFTYATSSGESKVINFKVLKESRGSGYQSVHFVALAKSADSDDISCEIQLRTLLQDVWGELEHALSYKKGKIHPHISNSFQLLATELQAKDELVGQLRDIRDQETAMVRYASQASGPSKWLNYPNQIKNELSDELIEVVREFGEHCGARKKARSIDEWRSKAEELIGTLEGLANDGGERTAYVLNMEKAFLKYACGDLKGAQSIYEHVSSDRFGEGQWFPMFRLGEIHLAQESIGSALVAFDSAEEKMKDADGGILDKYYAKVGLAYSYWSLGREFLDIAIRKMEEASKIVGGITQDEHYSPEEILMVRFSVANNLCFYYLERWINTPDDSGVATLHERKQQAETQYKVLSSLVEANPNEAFSNAHDTLAWYCFNSAKRSACEKDCDEWLKNAFNSVQVVEQTLNRAPSRVISNSIQREHMQQILSMCMRTIHLKE